MQNYYILDPTRLSYETIRAELIEYVQNLPDASKWKDFYESGTGTTQIELLAGMGAFLSFHSLGARRESYIDTCKLYTSAINLCNIIGYPVQRLSAPRLRINFTLASTVFWDRTIPAFAYRGRNVSFFNSQTLLAGERELDFVVGDWKALDFSSTTNDKFANLLVLDTGIDTNLFGDTLELFVNGVNYPLIQYTDNFLPTNVMIKTYQGGVLLVFGDGYIGYQLRVNDTVDFNYVNTSGPLGATGINIDELTKFLNCTINSVEILNPGYNADSIPKMVVVAPGYLTSKRRMVTGPDHTFIFMNYSGSMISAGWQKENESIGCCTILLSYLFDDEHLASIPELDTMYSYLDDFKMVGERISIQHPVKTGIEMKVVIIIAEGVQQIDLETAIREVVTRYSMQLGTTFHIGQVTAELSNIDGVLRVYLVRPVSDKTLEYNRYLKLVGLDVIVTANRNYVVEVDPDNLGYWRFLTRATTTGVGTKKLIDSAGYFTSLSIVPGSLVTNKDENISAHIVSIDSTSQITLDTDIFTASGQTYELYDVQEG